MQWLLGSQVRIEGLDGGKESVIFLVPCKRSRVIPFLLTFGEAEGPIEKITDVGENLARRTGGFGAAVVGETGGGVADSLASAIGERSYGVAQQGLGVGHEESSVQCV